jgi:hypothetical protein
MISNRYHLIACALICCGAWSVSGCGSSANPDEAHLAADAFLTQIRAGDVDQAWEATSSEFKSYMGRDRLRHFVRTASALKEPATLQRCQPAELDTGLVLVECVYVPEKSDKTIRVLLDDHGGVWTVERLYVE